MKTTLKLKMISKMKSMTYLEQYQQEVIQPNNISLNVSFFEK